MMIEKRFFVWNEMDNNTPVKLGGRIRTLLEKKIIIHSDKDDESQFRLANNENIWVGSRNDLVYFIYFTGNSGDDLLGFDPFEFEYPATEQITQFLAKKYNKLPYQDTDEVRKNYTGDLLYLIFRDFNPSNVFLMRVKN